MLRIRLFGTAQAWCLDNKLPGFPEQQASQLLCFLVLFKNKPHLRDRLAANFWGEYSNEIARKYLRNALWKLKQLMNNAGVDCNEYIRIDEQCILFMDTSSYWLDIEEFENISNMLQSVPPVLMDREQVESLLRANMLYKGDLLENIYSDWCLAERERFRLMNINNLRKLMLYHDSHGEYNFATKVGRRILEIDPASEKVHRHLMLIFAKQRNRSAAISQYNQLRKYLWEEMGLHPLPETQRAYERIIANRFDAETIQSHNKVANQAIPISNYPQTITATKGDPSQLIRERIIDLQLRLEEIHNEICSLEKTLNQLIEQ